LFEEQAAGLVVGAAYSFLENDKIRTIRDENEIISVKTSLVSTEISSLSIFGIDVLRKALMTFECIPIIT
jgi:hypothetical protein